MDRARVDEFPVVENQAYPEIIHHYWEAGHNRCDAPWAAEFVAASKEGID